METYTFYDKKSDAELMHQMDQTSLQTKTKTSTELKTAILAINAKKC